MENVENSDGVNRSYGVNGSDGVNVSNGVNGSDGVNVSDGVNGSYGIFNSFGVDKALFLADKKRQCTIFGKDVSGERFFEVWNTLRDKLNGWYPKFNNATYLFLKVGSDWKKVNASKICGTLKENNKPYEAWKDMPVEAIEFVKSLPEFDSVMFFKITGIDTSASQDKSLVGAEVEVKVNGKSYKAKIISD